ncbi:hypothetical protein LTR85_003098 [Meristemomyces frigidus]|nr:hypothetical protein LTR85_003098 [Meristemomyces frigidus]
MAASLGGAELPPFTLENVAGKGKGLVANHSISPGSTIIAEAPLFTTEGLSNPATTEKDLAATVRSLPKESQRAFLSLHNNNPGRGEPLSNIVRSNGYPLGPSSEVGGIFPVTARINHSCRPNAQHAWSNKMQKMLVHAVRDIHPGDELTLSYIAGGASTVRKRNLKDYFGFDCTCELCSLPRKQQRISDERLERAQQLDDSIGDSKRVKRTPEKALDDCHALLQIFEQEQIFDLRLPRLYYDAFQICAVHSDRARASIFAQRSRDARVICEGPESEEAESLEQLVEDPARFENFGFSRRWESTVDDVPDGASAESFGEWLWRPKHRKLVTLNRTSFAGQLE